MTGPTPWFSRQRHARHRFRARLNRKTWRHPRRPTTHVVSAEIVGACLPVHIGRLPASMRYRFGAGVSSDFLTLLWGAKSPGRETGRGSSMQPIGRAALARATTALEAGSRLLQRVRD
jgi:hypothetical protein